MDLISQAQSLCRKHSAWQTFQPGPVRYFYFPDLWALGLNHLFTSKDVNMKIGGREEDPDLYRDWQNFIKLMPGQHREYYFMLQEHTDQAARVDEEGLGQAYGLGRRLTGVDGLYTSRPDFLLSSSFGDCAPLLLYNPRDQVQANIHSGWKGTLHNVGGKTLAAMLETYELQPEDFYLAIGPHIGRDDFEVEDDVADLFSAAYPELPDLVRPKPDCGPRRKYLVDLQLCLCYNFLKAGLPADQIFLCNKSTVAHPEDLHSYRRDKANFGLMMGLSQIRS